MFIFNYFTASKTSSITIKIDGTTMNENQILSQLNEKINSATDLKIKNCSLSEPILNAILKRKNIQKISFKNCPELIDSQVEKFVKGYKSSPMISIKDCSKLMDGIWNGLSKIEKLPSLTTAIKGIKNETTQINASSIDPKGFSYFIQSHEGKACLLKVNMSNGEQMIVNPSLPILNNSYGVMCAVRGNMAILVTSQPNEENIESTNIGVANTETNEVLFPLTKIPKENTIYNVEIGSFNKTSPLWACATEINSSNKKYQVDQIKLHVFLLSDQKEQKIILLDYVSPVQNLGCSYSTFVSETEIALIAYGSNLESYVFYVDLAKGTNPKKYIVPVDPERVNGGFTATNVFDREHPLAVMDAKGDIYTGPVPNSDKFVLEASMGGAFPNAAFYTALTYLGNHIFAFYAETECDPKKRTIGFFNIKTKERVGEITVQVDGNADFYMKRFQLLESGKLGLTIVSRYLSDKKETTWDYNFELDIPKN